MTFNPLEQRGIPLDKQLRTVAGPVVSLFDQTKDLVREAMSAKR